MKEKYTMRYEFVPAKSRRMLRIIAARDIGENIHEGDLGGLIDNCNCLSQQGDCWVYFNAKICGFSQVTEGAVIAGNAIIEGHSRVFGNAIIENAIIKDYCNIYDFATVRGGIIAGYSRVFGKAKILCETGKIPNVTEYATIKDNAIITLNARIKGNSIIENSAIIMTSSEISDNAIISGNTTVKGSKVSGDSIILGNSDIVSSTITNSVTLLDCKIEQCSFFGTWIKYNQQLKRRIISGDGK